MDGGGRRLAIAGRVTCRAGKYEFLIWYVETLRIHSHSHTSILITILLFPSLPSYIHCHSHSHWNLAEPMGFPWHPWDFREPMGFPLFSFSCTSLVRLLFWPASETTNDRETVYAVVIKDRFNVNSLLRASIQSRDRMLVDRRKRLRSSSTSALITQSSCRTTIGDLAFFVAAPHSFIHSFVSLIMPPTTRNWHTTSNHCKQKPNPKLKLLRYTKCI